jgi:hypothetical protein
MSPKRGECMFQLDLSNLEDESLLELYSILEGISDEIDSEVLDYNG